MAEIEVKREVSFQISRPGQFRKTSIRTIRGILKNEGYTDKEIETMHSENRIVIIPEDLGKRVQRGFKLVVTDKKPLILPPPVDRFEDLEDM